MKNSTWKVVSVSPMTGFEQAFGHFDSYEDAQKRLDQLRERFTNVNMRNSFQIRPVENHTKGK